jgi:hypothetical protein
LYMYMYAVMWIAVRVLKAAMWSEYGVTVELNEKHIGGLIELELEAR